MPHTDKPAAPPPARRRTVSDLRASLSAHLRAFTSPKHVVLLVTGIALVGAGIGLMLASGLGAGPVDALFAALAARSGFSVGTVLVAASVAMVAIAWLLGTRSGLGTLACFLGIGVFVDVTMLLVTAVGYQPDHAPMGAQAGVWLSGLLLLGFGACELYASGLGASAYDQFVRAFTRFGVSLPVARLLVDGVGLLAALLLTGPIGPGTVGVLIGMPLMFKLLLPPMLKFAGTPAHP